MFAVPEVPSRKRKSPSREQGGSEEYKSLLLVFENAVVRNQEERIRFKGYPDRFMEGELALFQAIQSLSPLSTSPSFYPTFIKLNSHISLLSLLEHENSDILIAVLGLFSELLDADSLQTEEGVQLLDSLLEVQGLEAVIQSLDKLDAAEEEDRNAFLQVIELLETLMDLRPDLSLSLCQGDLFGILLKYIRREDSLMSMECSELLAILLQVGGEEVAEFFLADELFGMDKCLSQARVYAERDPQNAEEEETAGNIFNSLSAVLSVPKARTLFLEGGGFELCRSLVKRARFGRAEALTLMTLSIHGSAEMCAALVDAGGLKTLFSVFMGRGKVSTKYEDYEALNVEQTLSCLFQLFQLLVDVRYQRLVYKFQEKNFEKVDRLIELHLELSEFEDEESVAFQVLMLLDLIISFVLTVDVADIKEYALKAMSKHSITIPDIVKNLDSFLEATGDDEGSEFQCKVVEGLKSMISSI